MPSPKLQYFDYEHLPPHLQTVSKPVGDLARQMDAMLPDSSQKELGMQSLLDAKDRFVRAALPPKTTQAPQQERRTPDQERRISIAAAQLGVEPGDIDEIRIPGPVEWDGKEHVGSPAYACFRRGRRMDGGVMFHEGAWRRWNGSESWPESGSISIKAVDDSGIEPK